MSTFPDPGPIVGATPEEVATELITRIRTLVQTTMPGFTFLGPRQRRRIVHVATLHDDFLENMARAIEVSPWMAGATRVSPAQLRSTVAYRSAWRVVKRELELIARGVGDSILSTCYEPADDALRLYQSALKQNRPGDREELVPHIERIRRSLARGRTTTEPEPEPEPEPDAPAPQPGTSAPPRGNGKSGVRS